MQAIFPVRPLAGMLLLFSIAVPLQAQLSLEGEPLGLDARSSLGPAPATLSFPAVDHQQLLAEDALEGKDVPLRFGAPFETDIRPSTHGQWETLPDGQQLWRLALECPGALSTNLVFEDFALPAKTTLFVYNPDNGFVIGAFGEHNNRADGIFATQPVPGEGCVLELRTAISPASCDFRIRRVIHGYRDIFDLALDEARDYGDSGGCNNNVNCPEGEDWQGESRSVAMITTGGGFRICSGALINNTAHDATQYFLTANHCLGGETSWVFIFNYESPGCANQNGPTTDSVQGAILRASRDASDFALLELTEDIPPSYEVTYSGWDARDIPAPGAVGIHHPSGDIKKISFDEDALISSGYFSGGNSHWRVADWEDGTTEGGSSGSPLYNPEHRIVGQLHGGEANCSNNVNDYYGKFSMSWDAGSNASSRLVDWLDPIGTGEEFLDGLGTGPGDMPNLLVADWRAAEPEAWPIPGASLPIEILLRNSGLDATGITGTLSSDNPWISASENVGSWPNIAYQNDGWSTIGFSITIDAEAVAGESVVLSLSLAADGGYAVTREFELLLGHWQELFVDDFSADSGWELDTGWEIGPAQAGGGQYGEEDPAEDTSPGEDNGILGYQIGGDYENSISLTRWARSPQIDLSDRIQTRLVFQRWLGLEQHQYDEGYIEVFDGLQWHTIWTNEGTLDGGAWEEIELDVSQWADDNPAFRVGFGIGPTDGSWQFCGWNIDDLRITGVDPEEGAEAQPPVLLQPRRVGNDLLLSWQPGAGADWTLLEWSTDPQGPWQTLGVSQGDSFRVIRGFQLLGSRAFFRGLSGNGEPPLAASEGITAEELRP